jgi:hypothetical protein
VVAVPGLSARFGPTADAAVAGSPCCTSLANCSRVDAVLGWLTRVSRDDSYFVTSIGRLKSGCGWAASQIRVSLSPRSPAACISGRICVFGRAPRRQRRLSFDAATVFPVGRLPVACTCAAAREARRAFIQSKATQPSPNGRRVGIRIVTFEACLSFTHVTAHRIAQSPKATFVTRLQKPSRSSATGSIDNSPGGIFLH